MAAGRKTKCSKCYGTGFYSGRYGQTACDMSGCYGTGYIYVTPEKCSPAYGTRNCIKCGRWIKRRDQNCLK